MAAHDVDRIRTAYQQFAEHDAAAVLVRSSIPRVEWVARAGRDSSSGTCIGPYPV
jgi:hypothetical protein